MAMLLASNACSLVSPLSGSTSLAHFTPLLLLSRLFIFGIASRNSTCPIL
jgi:hypothetical protein